MEATGQTLPIITNRQINKQINEAEGILEETKREQRPNLTREGKKILDATERLLEDARVFVNERNANDNLALIAQEAQQFYNDFQTNRTKWSELHTALQNPRGQFNPEKALQKMNSISRTAKLVAIELVASSSFRQTVTDFISVFYTILVDASQIDRVGKPLSEAYDQLTYGSSTSGNKEATEKLKIASEEAIRLGIDYFDPDKQAVVLTQDQKDHLWKQLRAILNEMSKRERTQRIVHGIFEIMEMVYRPLYDVTSTVSATSDQMLNDEHIQSILMLSQELFESFTQTSLDPLISHLKVVYASVSKDERLQEQISVLKRMILNLLEHPELLGQEKTYDEFMEVIDDISQSLSGKVELKNNLAVVRQEFSKMIYALEQDPLTLTIQRDIKQLVQTILLDDKGRISFKPEVLDQLKMIVLSSVIKRLRVPLPELIADDPNSSFAFKVNGLIMAVQDILPERIIAENRGIAIVNVRDKTAEKGTGSGSGVLYSEPTVAKASEAVRIRMENINVHMPDADVWFHKRTFPEIQDSGKATIDMGGKGMDLTFVLKTQIGSDKLFKLASVQCDIHELSLKLAETTHDSIYNLFITLFKGSVKRNIEEAIQESMAGVFEQLNEQIEKQVKSLKNNLPSLLS